MPPSSLEKKAPSWPENKYPFNIWFVSFQHFILVISILHFSSFNIWNVKCWTCSWPTRWIGSPVLRPCFWVPYPCWWPGESDPLFGQPYIHTCMAAFVCVGANVMLYIAHIIYIISSYHYTTIASIKDHREGNSLVDKVWCRWYSAVASGGSLIKDRSSVLDKEKLHPIIQFILYIMVDLHACMPTVWPRSLLQLSLCSLFVN